jgi:septal ring factor EnvC (AmiA/AmiB activator)
MVKTFKLNKKLKAIRRLKNAYIEKGKLIAVREFNKQLKELSNEHLETIVEFVKTNNNELKAVNKKTKELENELQTKINKIDEIKSKLIASQTDIDLIHSECSRYYNNLKDTYHDERKKKMVSIEYDKSSVDHLKGKVDNLINKSISEIN